jgi:hypothetical protein
MRLLFALLVISFCSACMTEPFSTPINAISADAAQKSVGRSNAYSEVDDIEVPPKPPIVELSLTDKAVECTCFLKELAIEFRKEIDAAGPYQRDKLTGAAAERMKQQDCIQELNAEMDKMSEEDRKQLKKEIQAGVKNKCPKPINTFEIGR